MLLLLINGLGKLLSANKFLNGFLKPFFISRSFHSIEKVSCCIHVKYIFVKAHY